MGRAAQEVGNRRIASDRAVVSEAGSAADGAARFDTLTGVYCSAGRAGDGTCRGEDAWHGADLRPGTLLDRRTFGSEAELHAAVELSRNLAAPVVHDPLAARVAETDRERRLGAARGRARADARTALAADWFGHARSLRAPGADLGAWADAVSGGRGRDTGEPVSRYELMELLASRRFDDPGRFIALQEMSAENLLRELVMLQSIDLMLDWEAFSAGRAQGRHGGGAAGPGDRGDAPPAGPHRSGRRAPMSMRLLRFLLAPELGRCLHDMRQAARRLGGSVRVLSDGSSPLGGEDSCTRALPRNKQLPFVRRSLALAATAGAGAAPAHRPGRHSFRRRPRFRVPRRFPAWSPALRMPRPSTRTYSRLRTTPPATCSPS